MKTKLHALAKYVEALDWSERILIILTIAVQSRPITFETRAYAASITR